MSVRIEKNPRKNSLDQIIRKLSPRHALHCKTVCTPILEYWKTAHFRAVNYSRLKDCKTIVIYNTNLTMATFCLNYFCKSWALIFRNFPNHDPYVGQWCGSVGRAVASNSIGPRFECSHQQNLYRNLLSTELKRRKLRKRGREWPIFLKKRDPYIKIGAKNVLQNRFRETAQLLMEPVSASDNNVHCQKIGFSSR